MAITILKFLPWAILGSAVLFGGHYFLYYSFIKLFRIDIGWVKSSLLTILFLLPLGFILSSILAHFKYGFFTKFFYIASAFYPKVKNIEVEIKNLSSDWKNKTIVQFEIIICYLIGIVILFR
mgnify:CR=1 FL=1